MEQNEVSTINEQPVNDAGFAQPHPTTPLDLGSGLSEGGDTVFGSEYAEDSDTSTVEPSAMDTLPFTQAASAYVTPPYPQEYGSVVPTAVAADNQVATVVSDVMKKFTRRQARPSFVARGQNILIPYGATSFIKAVGGTNITSINSLGAVTATMNKLVPNMNTPGSYREVANWKRVSDLKNVVVSYFNRSIPFTDLEESDRFAIEIEYMAEIASCIMPLRAKQYALSMVKHWKDIGYQYDTKLLTNLNSLTAERLCKEIYSAIASLPSLDDVMLKRMMALTKLRVSSKKDGFTPTIILQDLTIGRCGRYALSNVSLSSGYRISTNMSALTDAASVNGTTFMEWVELWLRADLFAESDVVDTLSAWLSLAQSIRTNFAILLGCAQQLTLKGSVDYTPVGDFLPIEGVDHYCLKYKIEAPTFNYAIKERFEYAPRWINCENKSGTNITGWFNLGKLPAAASTDYSQSLSFRRPVGLYKGAKCWNTSEIATIGLFRETDLNDSANAFILRTGVLNNMVFGTIYKVFGTDGQYIMDAYYGDLYCTALNHVAKTVNGQSANTVTFVAVGELVSYYGYDSMNAPFACVSSYYADGGLETNPVVLINGTQILDFTNYDMSVAESPVGEITANLAAILEQMDITLYISNTKNDAGRICSPIVIFTNYRGCEFDEFDLAPLDNSFADSYLKLSISLKSKARVE